MTTAEYRTQRLQEYRAAIAARVLLSGYRTLEQQICHYDQLVMLDRDMSRLERELREFTDETAGDSI